MTNWPSYKIGLHVIFLILLSEVHKERHNLQSVLAKIVYIYVTISFNQTIEFMFVGINIFWARLRLILARAIRRGLKWALRRAQNIFMLIKLIAKWWA